MINTSQNGKSLKDKLKESILYWEVDVDDRDVYFRVKDILEIFEKYIDKMIKDRENSDWWYNYIDNQKIGMCTAYESQMLVLKEIKEMMK